MNKFPKISSYKNAIADIIHRKQFAGLDEDGRPIYDTNKFLGKILFHGTTKIHGTNASIVYDFKNRKVFAQSRERILSVGSDNHGFALFVESLGDRVYDLLCSSNGVGEKYDQFILFGEWAGSGVQNGVAVNQIKHKSFFHFATLAIKGDKSEWVPFRASNHDLRVYSIEEFTTFEVEIDLHFPQNSVNELNILTEQVANNCPVGKFFGIDGFGEGIVWSAKDGSGNMFKTKSDKHGKGAKSKLASLDPKIHNEIKDFVEAHAHDERFQQGIDYLKEMNLPVDTSSTGAFLSWFVKDILKEEAREIVESDFNSKSVSSAISNYIRPKYLSYVGNF